MPNTVPSLLAAGTLPDPTNAVTRRPIESSTWNQTALLQHHAHARGQIWRAGQTWPEDVCRMSAADGILTWPLLIPLQSSHHLLMTVHIEAKLDVGAASVRAIMGTGGTVALPVTAGVGYAWYSAAVALPAAGDTDTVYLDTLGVGAGETLTVRTWSAHITPLASPLPATVATTPPGRFVPLGDTTTGPDYPLPSGRTRPMLENLADLYQRRRTIYAWAGLHDDVIAVVGASAAVPYMQPRPYLSMPRLQLGDETYAGGYKVAAYVERYAADRYLRVQTGTGGRSQEIVVTGGVAGKVWASGALDLRDVGQFGGVNYTRNTGLTVTPSLDIAAEAPHTTTRVYSMTVYGV